MTPKQRLRLADLDLSVIDPLERTTQYIYDEIFVGGTYEHPQIKLPERATIIDVGANIGLFTIWAARKHRPRIILAYEASPTTHECLVANVARHVDSEVTGATCVNLAVSREAGQELVLHQPPWVCGLSTILDGATLPGFTSAPLERAIEIAGHPVVSLWLTSSEPDAAVFVYLSEVEADGTVRYVTEGLLRAIHRAEAAAPANYRTSWPWRSFARKDVKPMPMGEPPYMAN